jgi:hypothetical protein
MPFEGEPQSFNPEEPEKIKTEEEKKDDLEQKISESKKEVFEEAGEHSPEVLFEKMRDLEGWLRHEKEEGEGKLKDTINEIRKGPDGEKSFVDKSVAYLPPKGEAVFIGDLHGDSEAAESIIEQSKFIEKMEKGEKDISLVFLGDYADRGDKDIATVEEVMNLKLRYPENVVLLRGNHEETETGSRYGLQKSLVEKYGEEKGRKLFGKYNEMVKEIPGAVVTGNGIVGVHGGIPSQEIGSLKDLNNEKILEEMRWNDPTEKITGRTKNKDRDPDGITNFSKFGHKPFERFMEKIGGKKMIRSHEYPPEGHEEMFDGKLHTIFSNGSEKSPSSGYKDKVKNAMFIKTRLDKDEPSFAPEIVTYEKTEKKSSINEAQNFMDLFKALNQIEGLKGTQDSFSSSELRRTINKVRAGKAEITEITRTSGLRDKVIELLEKEKSK